MADFRRWLYAFAVVALLAGLTIPASAQNTIQCQTNTSVPPVVRSQGYAELVGDLVLSCTGGSPTAAGAVVPPVNVTVFLTTNITSKLLSSNGFDEALLIIDDPNSTGANSNRPILNCGAAGAPDSGPSGPGVCSITSNGNPQQTYSGTPGAAGGAYGTGNPNVFQGRTAVNGTLSNAVVFNGVPLDPPGTGTSRTLRITNIRADAEFLGVSGNFTTNSITMNIAVNGNTSLSINNPSQIVAFIQNGLTTTVPTTQLSLVQCNSQNATLITGSGLPYTTTGFTGSPSVTFAEGFATSFKPKNIAMVTANGSLVGGDYAYNGNLNYPSDVNQNVPGTINYNTETGFSYASTANPTPNPPVGIGTGSATGAINTNQPFADANGTGIAGAGVATQGTRLVLNLSSVPGGASVYVPPIIYLHRQGTLQPSGPTAGGASNAAASGGPNTGVMVLTSTDANGAGAFSGPAVGSSTSLNLVAISTTGGSGLAVYEVLFADPSSLEQADIPVVVAYVSNLSTNAPIGSPTTGVTSQVTGGFAPFYSTAAARLPSSSLPVPRFVPGTTPINAFLISKCSCNLLFPFVTTQAGFDTGIAIANTTADPSGGVPGTNGFAGVGAQAGTVTFYYYGLTGTNGPPPASQTSGLVNAGQVLTYDMYSGGGSIGSTTTNGLTNTAAGFQGYIIAQASFQYCHGFAFISTLGAPGTGISEGYLGIVLDTPGLPRTLQRGENDGN